MVYTGKAIENRCVKYRKRIQRNSTVPPMQRIPPCNAFPATHSPVQGICNTHENRVDIMPTLPFCATIAVPPIISEIEVLMDTW